MGRTLILTSPLTQGDDVTATQRLLQGRDASHYAAFYKGALHGIYDDATAAAAKRAKFYLGYPTVDVNEQAGDSLRGYLGTPPENLPEDYQVRREVRLHPPARTPRQLALARAQSQIGVKENPAGSNLNPFGAWYGVNGVAWCAIFVTWCFDPFESVSFLRGSRYAYVPYIRQDALSHEHNLAVVLAPIPGDLVLYFWAGLGDPGDSHIGIFESGTATSWTAVEGNTSASDQSNGGEVQRRHRSRTDAGAVVFVRVGA